MATTSIPPLAGVAGLLSFPSLNPKLPRPRHSSLLFAFPPSLSAANCSRKAIQFQNPSQKNRKKSSQLWRKYASSGENLPADSTVLEKSKEIVSASAGVDERLATIISGLLFLAFVGLAVLTVGVVYIAVNDFLQKREKDKYEKDTAEMKKKKRGKNKKQSGKKNKVAISPRAKAGPRKFGAGQGFGQKIDVFEDEDEDD